MLKTCFPTEAFKKKNRYLSVKIVMTFANNRLTICIIYLKSVKKVNILTFLPQKKILKFKKAYASKKTKMSH